MARPERGQTGIGQKMHQLVAMVHGLGHGHGREGKDNDSQQINAPDEGPDANHESRFTHGA